MLNLYIANLQIGKNNLCIKLMYKIIVFLKIAKFCIAIKMCIYIYIMYSYNIHSY